MISIYKTVNGNLVSSDTFEEGVWINLTNPTEEELLAVRDSLGVELDMLKAALDEEERARVESDDGNILIIVDTPLTEKESGTNLYYTIPLGIVIAKHRIITVCLKCDTILTDFTTNRVKAFFTQYRTRFVLQILYKNAVRYLQYLKNIDKISGRIEQDLHKSMRNKELFMMLKLEKSLVYFSTALKSNEIVLEKLTRFEYIKNYPEDKEILEDVIIENKQAIEMANIYSNILSGTMDAFASIISNNLNIVMKFLTSITIVMAIPTMIASFFGMNVPLPIDGRYGFLFIFFISFIVAIGAGMLLWRKRMF